MRAKFSFHFGPTVFKNGILFSQAILSMYFGTYLCGMVYFSRKCYLIATTYYAQTYFTVISNFKNPYFFLSVFLESALIFYRNLLFEKMVFTRRGTSNFDAQKKDSKKKVCLRRF